MYTINKIEVDQANCKDQQGQSVSYTVEVPMIITGLRPYRSATLPQKTDPKALPSMYDDPS